MPIAKVVQLVRDVGRGLDAARSLGIVHRDLKPRNLYFAEAGGPSQRIWKILDFGVSKLMDGVGTQTKDCAAAKNALDAETRACAERLAMKQPWGTIGTRASGERVA